MITKCIFGSPFETESVVNLPADAKVLIDDAKHFPVGTVSVSDGFTYTLTLRPDDMIFGLGQAMGGINKRGRIYRSWCTDDPCHTEEKESLYGAHNFFAVYSPEQKQSFALYFDYPGELVIDAGFTETDVLSVRCAQADIAVYYNETRNRTF